jgi:hypothetical protein
MRIRIHNTGNKYQVGGYQSLIRYRYSSGRVLLSDTGTFSSLTNRGAGSVTLHTSTGMPKGVKIVT